MDWKTLIGAKSFDELMAEAQQRLTDKNSGITNWNNGGIFKTLTALAMQGLADFFTLLVDKIVPMGFIDYSKGVWLDLKVKEVSIERRQAKKAVGIVTFGREEAGPAKVIPAGSIVKTDTASDGQELRYFSTQEVVLLQDVLTAAVPVRAEFEGARYNVGQGYIKHLVTHVEGIDYVTNSSNWVTEEGADQEDNDSLNARYKLKWNELATGSTRLAYISWAMSVPGVLDADADDMNPRGPGTVNVYIVGPDGTPTQALIDQVTAAIDLKRPYCVDVLVAGPELQPVNQDIILYLPQTEGDEAATLAEAEARIQAMFVKDATRSIEVQKIGKKFVGARAITILMGIKHVVNVSPIPDVEIAADELAVRGDITFQVQRVTGI